MRAVLTVAATMFVAVLATVSFNLAQDAAAPARPGPAVEYMALDPADVDIRVTYRANVTDYNGASRKLNELARQGWRVRELIPEVVLILEREVR